MRRVKIRNVGGYQPAGYEDARLLMEISWTEYRHGGAIEATIGEGQKAAGDRLLRAGMLHARHDRKTLRHGDEVRLTVKGAKTVGRFIDELTRIYRM